MDEIWKDIEGYEGVYQVSNLGRVKSLNRLVDGRNGHLKKIKERILKPTTGSQEYVRVSLYLRSKIYVIEIHRLVGLHFIPNPENKPEINHKDGIKAHCYESNLEWCTQIENSQHAWRTGLCKPNTGHYAKKGKDNPLSKPVARYDMFGNYIDMFDSIVSASICSGSKDWTISRIARGIIKNPRKFIWKFI
ncbi:MAG: NUMOD4 domain-containing protein [Candidatus Gastranaerophilaceae bacterium]|jgi:hypothetical protein